MFKQITAIILLLAFSVQTFSSPFTMLDYFVNTAAYAKNCVNKAKPKMHCNGQCQMMKKMQQEEKKDQQNSGRKTEVKVQVLSSKSFFCSVKIFSGSIQNIYPRQNINCTYDSAFPVFHPPQA
jgi:hypothetical protein